MRVIRQRKSRVPLALKILPVILVAVGVSYSLAWAWHTTQQSVDAAAAPEQAPPDDPADTAAPPDAAASASAESDTPPAGEGGGDTPPAQGVGTDGVVPASPPVDQSYFDDAIFFGDSISTGIPLYHLADNAAVVAMNGITTLNVLTKQAIDMGREERVTFLEAARQYGPRKKVYIMLGGNGLGYDIPTFLEGYKNFLDEVKALYPGAAIYLQSITPVTADYHNEFLEDFTNERIDAYNQEIKAFARRENVYYLDVASALKDETGALPKEASPADGLHFSPEYYVRWFDYLKTHTVEVPDDDESTSEA